MKVLIVSQDLRGGGGAEMVVSNLTQALSPCGIEFVLAHPKMTSFGEHVLPFPGRTRAMELQWEERSRGLLQRIQRLLHRASVLGAVIEEEKPDLVISTFSVALHQIVCLLKLRGLRESTIIRFGNPVSAGTSARDGFSRFLLRRGIEKCQGVIANSNGTADDVAQTLGISRKGVQVIPNPIPIASVRRRSEEPASGLPEGWGTDGVPLLVNLGRLAAQKNQAVLLRALAEVRKKRLCRLVLVGGGELESEYRELARSLSLEEDVHFAGWQENPFPYLRLATVFVLSSDFEGFGNVLVEAMACGCPVVSTDCAGGPRDILSAGEFGVLTPIGDVAAMADAISRFLEDETLRQSTIRRGLERAEDFEAESVATRYLSAFSAAVSGSRR
jgi:glycosyltransferase involved in cell wall biosynthesis